MLGFGCMRLPRLADNPREIDHDAADRLIDHALASGVNYFDTAYTYGGSEAFLGRSLTRHPRDSYNIATKCPPWMIKNEDDFERIFAEQLERCQAEYIDFFLVHNFAAESNRADGNEEYFKSFEKIGMYEMLQKKKAEGKVRHVGFSFHGTTSLLERVVSRYDWDFTQIQLNYIDWTATNAKRQYEILEEHNLPVTIMEPLRGGALATLSEKSGQMLKDVDPDASFASWGLRYAASFPNIKVVLSGMNAMEQLTDNIATMSDFKPLTEEEKEFLYKVASAYNQSGAVPCTGCEYCMPCPLGVEIPRVFALYNYYRISGFRIPFDNAYSTLTDNERASNCIQCGQCVKKCPQHLTIPEFMEEINDFANSGK